MVAWTVVTRVETTVAWTVVRLAVVRGRGVIRRGKMRSREEREMNRGEREESSEMSFKFLNLVRTQSHKIK